MIVEYAYLKINRGEEGAFECAFEAGYPALTSAEGCVTASLHRDAEHESAYLLKVTWQKLGDHLDTFPNSEAGRRFAEHVAHHFDGAPEVRHFEEADASG